jgi:hypothetical protein
MAAAIASLPGEAKTYTNPLSNFRYPIEER